MDGFQDFGAQAKRARRRRNNQVRLSYFAIYFYLSVVSPKGYITLVLTAQPAMKREGRNLTYLPFNFLLKAVLSSKLLRILNLKSFLGIKHTCLFLMMKDWVKKYFAVSCDFHWFFCFYKTWSNCFAFHDHEDTWGHCAVNDITAPFNIKQTLKVQSLTDKWVFCYH